MKAQVNSQNKVYVDNGNALIAQESGGNAEIIYTQGEWLYGKTLNLDKTFQKYGSYGFTYKHNMLIPNNSKEIAGGSGVHNSFAMVKIPFTIFNATNLTVTMNQSSEQGYDYGFLSKLDVELHTDSSSTDTNGVDIGGSGGYQYGSKGKVGSFIYTFENVQAGDHFITVKYKKDGSASSGSDWFSIVSIIANVDQVNKSKTWVDTGEDIDVVRWADESIPTPTGTLNIDQNGNYDVTNYANASVSVSGGGSGYKLLVRSALASSDYIKLELNGADDTEIWQSEQVGETWDNFSCITINGGVTTFRVHGAQHAGGYPSRSDSWARYRYGTGNWTNINVNDSGTIQLTGDAELQIFSGTCLNKGTLITMADGTKKPVEEIEVGDYVKGYDGKSLKVLRSQKGQRAFGEDRDIWNFEDGKQIITTYRHRFYNMEHQKMMYLNEWQLGEHAYTEDGEQVALVEHIHEDTPCMHFSLWCEEENYFAGGLLAGNRFTGDIKL